MEACGVCEGPVTVLGNGMLCSECGRAFHLRLQEDDSGPQCGMNVHLSELGLGCCGMLYVCRRCEAEIRRVASVAAGS